MDLNKCKFIEYLKSTGMGNYTLLIKCTRVRRKEIYRRTHGITGDNFMANGINCLGIQCNVKGILVL
jgi:hypothetical protein